MADTSNPDNYHDYLTNLHDKAYYGLKLQLRAMCDNEIQQLWEHLCAENFRPDIEFDQFKLEGRLTADEFIEVLLEEVDSRSRKTGLQPEPA